MASLGTKLAVTEASLPSGFWDGSELTARVDQLGLFSLFYFASGVRRDVITVPAQLIKSATRKSHLEMPTGPLMSFLSDNSWGPRDQG